MEQDSKFKSKTNVEDFESAVIRKKNCFCVPFLNIATINKHQIEVKLLFCSGSL